jgi:hypothetical protein
MKFIFFYKYGSRRTPGRFLACSRPLNFFLKADLKSGGQDRAFWHQGEVSSLKIEEVSFSLDFFIFNKYEVAGSRRKSPYLSRSILTGFPTSDIFSKTCSEIRRLRQNFWRQKDLPSMKTEEID